MHSARAPSRNDIFSTSWQSSESLVPALPPSSDLVRRRTTGPAWRRPRKSPPHADSIFPEPDARINLGHSPPPIPPALHLQTELDATPSPLSSARTSSFFDISPNTGLFPPPSPYSTRSISTASLSSSSTNPSLAASLPPSPPTCTPLQPVQLRFTPRPEFKLGQGRFSKVYLASCRVRTVDDKWRVCVVKRLEPDDESQALGLREAWFLRQLRASASDTHPGQHFITRLLAVEVEEKEKISPTYGHSRSVSDSAADMLRGALQGSHRQRYAPGRTLLVLEYYPLTLSSLLSTHPNLLTPTTFTRLASELTHALAYCHARGILHTDVKTANVLLSIAPLSVRLADFGSALHLPSLPSGLPTDAAGLGTLVYSAPEFFRPPPSEFGFPADVFSAGVTLSAALLGREPYARLGSARACRQWVSKGAYWMYEERERVDGAGEQVCRSARRSGSMSDEEENAVVGKEQFESVLGRECTPAELESLMASPSLHVDPPTNDNRFDIDPYSDGSPAAYFPGLDEATRASIRVPEELLFLLKDMCAPAPEQRPTIVHVARRLESMVGL
ncbi:aurora kinase [Ceratobasidium sp. AG-Ba]|nr:aurora kinase [Ceratobasidium sp. AG-Ba]